LGKPRGVVANIVDQSGVARRRRAHAVGEKARGIGGLVKSLLLVSSDHAVFAGDRIPLMAIIGWLDQLEPEIAQLALVVGQLEARAPGLGAKGGVVGDPVVDMRAPNRA